MQRTTRGTPRSTTWMVLVILAGALASSLSPVSSGDGRPGPFRDGFESGNFAAWTTVSTGADGSATVESSLVHDGKYAARLSDTDATGSDAYARAALAHPMTDLTVDGFFQILQEGDRGSNVPLVRLFDGAGTRMISVYRLNQSADQLWVQYSNDYFQTTGTLPLNTWGELTVHIVTQGAATGLLEIWLDGAPIYRATAAALGESIASVQIGNEAPRQTFTLIADSLNVAPGAPVDASAPTTSITSGPSGTVTSFNAMFAFSASEPATFICQLDGGAPSACASPQTYSNLSNGQHTFSVEATDTAGNVEPTPATQTWAVNFPCDPTAPAPTTANPGTVVVADNFESNDFSQWSAVTTEGDATATIQQRAVHGGRCAAELHVTASDTSRANLTKTLPPGVAEVWADGWFNIQREGSDPSSNVPTFRFFSGGNRVLDLSRQNGKGDLFVRTPNADGSEAIVSTGQSLTLNQWHHITIHALANGDASTVEVWLDGNEIYATTAATFGATTIDEAAIGAEHRKQDGDFVVDDVVIKVVEH